MKHFTNLLIIHLIYAASICSASPVSADTSPKLETRESNWYTVTQYSNATGCNGPQTGNSATSVLVPPRGGCQDINTGTKNFRFDATDAGTVVAMFSQAGCRGPISLKISNNGRCELSEGFLSFEAWYVT